MIIFKKIRYKNILSTGNIFTEIELNKHNLTAYVGRNGSSKCFKFDTPISIQNKKSGEIVKTTVGELYNNVRLNQIKFENFEEQS